VLLDVATLDKLLFESDEPVKPEGSWWWVARDWRGRAMAFAGMRACKHEANEGLALLTRAGVRARHRGQGLQKKLIKARVALAKRQGFREVITYVLGWNLASANSLIACGFRLYTPQEKYAGEKALYFRKVL
jgi:GNAT superfamily N-acetyltransferase